MRTAVDTNILVYAAGVNDETRRARALNALAEALTEGEVVLSVQVLKEFYRVLRYKARWTAGDARTAIERAVAGYEVRPVNEDVLMQAVTLTERHEINWWDAIVLAAAAEADCDVLLSEDLQPGFTWRGCRVLNPFA